MSRVTPRSRRTLQAMIHMPLGMTGTVDQWLTAIWSKTASQGFPRIKRAGDEQGLGMREWRPLVDAEGRWLRKVVVQLPSADELRRLHGLIHGLSIRINGHDAVFEVTSQYMDLDGGGQERSAHGGR